MNNKQQHTHSEPRNTRSSRRDETCN